MCGRVGGCYRPCDSGGDLCAGLVLCRTGDEIKNVRHLEPGDDNIALTIVTAVLKYGLHGLIDDSLKILDFTFIHHTSQPGGWPAAP